MALSGRVVALLLAGLLPVVLRPSLGTTWLWVLVVALAVLLDWALAPSPSVLELDRTPSPGVRLGTPAESLLVATNHSRRRVQSKSAKTRPRS